MKTPHLDDLSVLPSGSAILIVDDTVANLLAFSAVLKPLGCRIVLARSGAEALESALQEDFDLILMDIRMPEMNGFETAQLLRGRERTRRTPIVFMSAYEIPSAILLRKSLGSDLDFIPSPVDAQVLISKVRSTLKRTA
jgi:CheY-like chemotaxis protein